MTKSIIPLAGILLACVIAAGIPAVAAADPLRPAAAPVVESTPWYAHLGEVIGVHAQSDSHPVNATSVTTSENKNWWDNLWPFKDAAQKAGQPATAQQTPVQTPVQTPAQTPAQAPAVNQDHGSQKSGADTPQETRPVDPARAG